MGPYGRSSYGAGTVARSYGSAGTRTSYVRIKRTVNLFRTSENSTSQYVAIPALSTSTGVGMYFQLADLPSFSEYSNLFDEYRVNKLTYRFMPRFSSVDASGSSLAVPDVFTAIDTDGAFQIGSLNAMMQYGNLRFRRGDQRFTVSYSPKAFGAVAIGGGTIGGTASVATLTNQWFSLGPNTTATAASVDFYGLSFFAQLPVGFSAAGASTYSWDVYVTADISFRKTL